MDIIINADAKTPPHGSKPLPNGGAWPSRFLMSMGYAADRPPVADFLRCYHRLEGNWQVLAPISWQASHNDAMITAQGSDLRLSDAYSREIFTKVAAFFARDGVSMHYHDAYTWLVRTAEGHHLNSPPPHLILHQSLMPLIRAMDDTMVWQRCFTELQMLLSGLSCPEERTGLPSINGLWPYGAGRFVFNDKKPVRTDDQQMLDAFPEQVLPWSLQEPLTRETVLLIQQPNHIDWNQLNDLTCHYPTGWYWNDAAWLMPAAGFLKRIIRIIRGGRNAYQTKRVP